MASVLGMVGGELEGVVFLESSIRLAFSLDISKIAIKRELVVKNDWC
jgi:hypothetical protein